jgi:hypothetical protein
VTRIVLPFGVTLIADGGRDAGAFRGCSNLVTVVLPESLLSIACLQQEDPKKQPFIRLQQARGCVDVRCRAVVCARRGVCEGVEGFF